MSKQKLRFTQADLDAARKDGLSHGFRAARERAAGTIHKFQLALQWTIFRLNAPGLMREGAGRYPARYTEVCKLADLSTR